MCNAAESLLVHRDVAAEFLPKALAALAGEGVVLHTDASLLPRSRRAWSSWNYLSADDPDGERPVAVSYLINRLQPLPTETPVIAP